MYGIKIFKNSPFTPYPCHDIEKEKEDEYLSKALRSVERLYSGGIDLKNGYVVRRDIYSRLNIWNTMNDKLLHVLEELPEATYDKIDLPPFDLDTSSIKNLVSLVDGSFRGDLNKIDFNLDSIDILKFAVIRYPHILKMVDTPEKSNYPYGVDIEELKKMLD
ncbi:hypothetical protein EV174_001526 [Coemansia sp. RSA 2320]|nr:hypothetical protein EV174_001526 [Coemansia sp. RSA 2320]